MANNRSSGGKRKSGAAGKTEATKRGGENSPGNPQNLKNVNEGSENI